jgi:hypothetical protein
MVNLEPERERKKPMLKDVFEPNAPPHDLPFPPGANFTAYEVSLPARNERQDHTDFAAPLF